MAEDLKIFKDLLKKLKIIGATNIKQSKTTDELIFDYQNGRFFIKKDWRGITIDPVTGLPT